MALHRAECGHEEVACKCPGCSITLLRHLMDHHVQAAHLESAKAAAQLVQSLWGEVAKLKATAESEHRRGAASLTSWVFNWRADGWGPGRFPLHPTPHTLHSTPYTLHSTPYTLHHKA